MKNLIIAIMLVLVGCQSTGLGTPSGKPECTIHGCTFDLVTSKIIASMALQGLTMQDQSTNRLVFWAEASAAQSIFFGSRYDAKTMNEISFVVVETEPGTIRVVADTCIVGNPGSAFERRTNTASFLSVCASPWPDPTFLPKE